MEFPDLGHHCAKKTCNQLDFLPMKCDACEQIFCIDHFTYDKHECPSSYKKNVQVPVCPLCSKPVPIARGTSPDLAVSQHIDNQCNSDPAKAKRIYANVCSVKACKKKELVPVICDKCRQNFCLTHRLEVDHECQGFAKSGKAVSNSGFAAMFRQQRPTNQNQVAPPVPAAANVSTVQGNMTEDEALAKALQNSMTTANPESQEDRDRRLAEELQQAEYNSQQQPAQNRHNRSCRVA